jgi:hypothetical protein
MGENMDLEFIKNKQALDGAESKGKLTSGSFRI